MNKAVGQKIGSIRELAQKIREETAARLLEPDAVLSKLSEAAAMGQSRVVLRPENHMHLQNTKAAKELEALLAPLKVVARWRDVRVEGFDSCELEICL